jgi:hypothetical protein
MPRRTGPRKYDPRTAYLAGLAGDEVTLTFAEIERLVDAPLPPSAVSVAALVLVTIGAIAGGAALAAGGLAGGGDGPAPRDASGDVRAVAVTVRQWDAWRDRRARPSVAGCRTVGGATV